MNAQIQRLRAKRSIPVSLVIIATGLFQGCATSGFFEVSATQPSAVRPAIAYNVQGQTIAVAYLREMSTVAGKPEEVRLRLFDAKGKGQGAEIQPFGTGSHAALGRPAIAGDLAGKGFLLAVPARLASGTGDTVVLRFLDGKGSPVGSQLSVFSDKTWKYLEGDGVGSLHVVYNSLAKEFLVTVQRTLQGQYGPENGIWAQRVSASGSVIGAPVMLVKTAAHGIDSHTVAYAPVGTPAGGRYLFAFSGFSGTVQFLDKNAKSIAGVSLKLGLPEGGNTHPDAAYGQIDGKDRFLLVFSDEDNCRPGLQACTAVKDQWTGVWGVFIDPLNPSTAATAFPISKIWAHVAARRSYMPRVDYDAARQSFVVAWREVPTLNAQNKESRSHIRFNRIDDFVQDGLAGTTLVPDPPSNTVVSMATGTCKTPDAMCLSLEDPAFADVAATSAGAAVVWHQRSPPNVQIYAVVGRTLQAP